MTGRRLVLASGSPRRRELLGRLGIEPDVAPADVDERVRNGESPATYVIRLAEEKAATAVTSDVVVIGADTAVVLDGEILGKPTSRDHAAAMLHRLAGRDHEVITAVAVVAVDADGNRRTASEAETSSVSVTAISEDRLAWYVASGEPDDKAGAYGLQGAGALFADRVTGSVSNVIGLPLPLLDRLCRDLGIDLLAFRAGRT